MWQSNMSGLGWMVKGQLDLSLGLTFLANTMISAWTVIEKWTFQDFSNINALEIKFVLAVKKAKVNPDSSFVQTW